ncbi:hypothetical protein PV387_22180, partial [Streptomyces sp. ME02-6987-2C]|uniref:hypothetical protein n=1 Tax=Streptomyces sp. ME02-6987-2C TaxID=3028676 RepID=UPI0029BA5076
MTIHLSLNPLACGYDAPVRAGALGRGPGQARRGENKVNVRPIAGAVLGLLMLTVTACGDGQHQQP